MAKHRPRDDAAAVEIARLAAHAPRTRAVAEQIASLHEPCIGCTDCDGVCRELVEALTLPEAVARKAKPKKESP